MSGAIRSFARSLVRFASRKLRSSGCGAFGRAACAFGLLVAFTSSAAAQVRPAPRPATGPTPRAGTWEVGGGVVWLSGYDLGGQAAELTRNITTGTGRSILFDSNSELRPAAGFQGRLGMFLSPSLLVEGGLKYGRPIYAAGLSGDIESAPSITAEMSVTQYVVDGSAVWHFNNAAFGRGRGIPFVRGGVGYLRELLEGNELVETGLEFHAGAGIKYWFGAAPRRFGLRGDAGVSIRDGGFDFEDEVRLVPTAAASLVYIF